MPSYPRNSRRKPSLGQAAITYYRPALPDEAPRLINLVLTFEDALKLQFSLQMGLQRLLEAGEIGEGKVAAIDLGIHLDSKRIEVTEGFLRDDVSPGGSRGNSGGRSRSYDDDGADRGRGRFNNDGEGGWNSGDSDSDRGYRGRGGDRSNYSERPRYSDRPSRGPGGRSSGGRPSGGRSFGGSGRSGPRSNSYGAREPYRSTGERPARRHESEPPSGESE